MKSIEKKIYLGLLVCMLVSVVGTSFAYFTKSVSFTGSGGSVNASTADLIKVSYNAGQAINLENAAPGATGSKSFTVSVTPTTSQKSATYSIFLNITTNGFTKCTSSNKTTENDCILDAEELVYTLKDSTGATIKTGDLLDQTGKIELTKLTKTVESETDYTYTFEITFKNTAGDQNHNANKTFTSTIGVEFAAS